MPRFFVHVKRIVTYQLEVVADDAEDAEQIVQEGIDRWMDTDEDMDITQELPGTLVASEERAEIYDPEDEDDSSGVVAGDEEDEDEEDEDGDSDDDIETADPSIDVKGRDGGFDF